jgi:uncharacterized protein
MTTKTSIIETLRFHKSELASFGIENIGLFGSYLNDEQSNKKDIDLLVEFIPDKENFDNYMAICDFLEELFNNEKVDIVTKNGLSPYIGPKILKEVIYV